MSVVIVTAKRITDKSLKVSEKGLVFTRDRAKEVVEWAKLRHAFFLDQIGSLGGYR